MLSHDTNISSFLTLLLFLKANKLLCLSYNYPRLLRHLVYCGASEVGDDRRSLSPFIQSPFKDTFSLPVFPVTWSSD